MQATVGIDQTVHAEVSRVRRIAEAAAVAVFRVLHIAVQQGGVVAELPHAAAEEAVVGIDRVPVCGKVAGTVAHGVAIFAKEDGIAGAVVRKISLDLRHGCVHIALDVRNVVKRGTVGVLCTVIRIAALVMQKAGGVAAAEIRRHRGVVAPEPRLIAERPDHDRRMVLVPLVEPFGAVKIRSLPRGTVREVVPAELFNGEKTVRLDIRLVNKVEAVFVAELRHARVGRIMTGADHVDVILLADREVAEHCVHRCGIAEDGSAVVAVNAARLHRLAVQQHHAVAHLDAARADGQRDMLFAVLKAEVIQVRRLARPEGGIAEDKGDSPAVAARPGAAVRAGGGAEARGRVLLQHAVKGHGENRRAEVIRQLTADRDVAHAAAVAEEQVDLAENARRAEHILILEVGAGGVLDHQHAQLVLAALQLVGHAELGDAVRHLAVTDKFAVEPDIEAGGDALKGEHGVLCRKLLRIDGKAAAVHAAGVFVRQVRRVAGEGILGVGIVRLVVAQGVLPRARYLNAVGGHGADGSEVEVGDGGRRREEAEIPGADEGFEEGAFVSVAAERALACVKGDEVGVRRLTPDMQDCRVGKIGLK